MKAKIKDIGAKILSLVMLSLSLSFIGSGVYAALLTYYVSLASSAKINLTATLFHTDSLIDVAIGFVFLALASFVWGWKKNWKILGVFICITGLDFIAQSFDATIHPPFKEISPFDKMFPTSIIVGFISAAVLCFAVGLLIIRQTKKTTTS